MASNSDDESIRAMYEYEIGSRYNTTEVNSSPNSSPLSISSNHERRGYYLGIVKPENYSFVAFLRNDYCINCGLSVCFIPRSEPLQVLSCDEGDSTYTVLYKNDSFSITMSMDRSFIDTFEERLSLIED